MSAAELIEAYEEEKTALLRRVPETRLTSLEVSITLSLHSGTMKAEPDACKLLSVLCLLPDGIHVKLLKSMVSGSVRALRALKAVALVSQENQRIATLAPIREFMLEKHPPEDPGLTHIRDGFMALTVSAEGIGRENSKETVEMLTAQFGNINSVLSQFWTASPSASQARVLHAATKRLVNFSGLTRYGDCLPLLRTAELTLKTMGNLRQEEAECLRNLGAILSQSHRHEEAIAKLRAAVKAFKMLGEPEAAAQCTIMIGDALSVLARYPESLKELRDALRTFEACGSWVGTAQCNNILGGIFYRMGRYEESIQRLKLAKVGFERQQDQLAAARCTLGMAEVFYMLDRYEEAKSRLTEAKAAFERLGDRVGSARCAQGMGEMHGILGQYNETVDSLHEALEVLKAYGDKHGVAQCTMNLGKVLTHLEQCDQAMDKFREAKSTFEAMGDSKGSAQCTQLMGDVMYMTRGHGEAIKMFEEAKGQFHDIKDSMGEAQCLQSIGELMFRLPAQEDEAEYKLHEAKSTFLALGDRMGAAHCVRIIGEALGDRGLYSAAIARLEEARAIFADLQLLSGKARTCQYLARIYFVQERFGPALRVLREGVAAHDQMGVHEERSTDRLLLQLLQGMARSERYRAFFRIGS
ncbi:TPR-like protein [Calocera viscosa TUFC12733]|uniref:TPR-like protein n=1 Tax=Calocera viscosa (strain TUFC12733) TaxID=1330018 RepID=A0A167HD66_CALVF|nr:TPR-like protein [Calocera viscosa TUFC12733]